MLGKRRQVSKNYQQTVTCKFIKMRLSFSALVEVHKSQTQHIQGSSHQWHCHTDQIDQGNTNIVQSHLSESKGGMGKKIAKAFWLKTYLIAQWMSATWVSHLNRNCLAALFQVEPIHPWKLCGKTHFEASRVVFWSLLCYKELKLTTNRFTGRTLRGLLIQMQNISLRSSGMRRKQNFDSFWV